MLVDSVVSDRNSSRNLYPILSYLICLLSSYSKVRLLETLPTLSNYVKPLTFLRNRPPVFFSLLNQSLFQPEKIERNGQINLVFPFPLFLPSGSLTLVTRYLLSFT